MNLDLHFQTSTGSLVILSKSDAYALYQELQALFNIPINRIDFARQFKDADIISEDQWKSIIVSEPTATNAEVTEESPEPLRAEADEPYCDCFQCDPAEHNHI